MERAFTELAFQPQVQIGAILFVFGAGLVLVSAGMLLRTRGMPWRFAAILVLLAALLDPRVLTEEREALQDVAFLAVDESASQRIAGREDQTREAVRQLERKIADAGLELRVVRSGGQDASPLLESLSSAAQEVAPERISGAVLVTDGLVDDAEALEAFPGPVHVILTGEKDDFDRRIELLRAPTFGILREEAEVEFRVEEAGPADPLPATVEIRVDRNPVRQVPVRIGASATIRIPVERAGSIPVEIRLPPAPGELTERNNVAAFTFEGVRDRLRVLLVSGSPHPAARVWRNLLRADPAVDLVHFTILRETDSDNSVPEQELSLIEFPVSRLFVEEIDEFDLIVFDRWEQRGFLPADHLENIVRYVREGGAVLLAAGGEFAGVQGFSGEPIDAILPLVPIGGERVSAYRPALTETGERHPVTGEIADAIRRAGPWYRLVEGTARSGHTLLAGPGEYPLLALDRVGEGRVGVLASEHAWLWSRGHGGGGPHRELFRRTAHWLMREPDLEEEALRIRETEDGLLVSLRSLAGSPAEVRRLDPEGRESAVVMEPDAPGRWTGAVPDPAPGLWRFRSGDLETLAVVGGILGDEMAEVVSTAERLAPLSEATGGSLRRAVDGIPDVRREAGGGAAAGEAWIDLPRRDAYRVASAERRSLMPPWLGALLILGALAAAWMRESGRTVGLRRSTGEADSGA